MVLVFEKKSFESFPLHSCSRITKITGQHYELRKRSCDMVNVGAKIKMAQHIF